MNIVCACMRIYNSWIHFSTYRRLTIQFQFLLDWYFESKFIFFGWNNALLHCNLIVQTSSKNTHYWTIETTAWCNIQSIGVNCFSFLTWGIKKSHGQIKTLRHHSSPCCSWILMGWWLFDSFWDEYHNCQK